MAKKFISKNDSSGKQFTTGVHMTVWQTVEEDDFALQQLLESQEEIQELKRRHQLLEDRLVAIEKRVDLMETTETTYNSMLQTLKLILGK